MTRRPIPTTLHLPGGYDIRVRQVKRMADDHWAEWDVDSRTIYLRRSRGQRGKAADFAHELQHAVVDWADWFSSTRPLPPLVE